MPTTFETQRAELYKCELLAAQDKLREALASEPDWLIRAMANKELFGLAARVGYLSEIVRRNNQRSDNA